MLNILQNFTGAKETSDTQTQQVTESGKDKEMLNILKNFSQVNESIEERSLTKDEMSDREDYVKGMKKSKKDFKKRYGKDAESVMYATATKMAKEGVNESEESNVEEKKQENVQAEERQQDLNWLEDIKRLSGLDNTYENSVDAMKEYKVDESVDTEQEVIAESTEEQVEEATGYRADKKGKVDKSEKKHYHCKLTKDGETKGVRMVKDEDESEDDLKARCKRENMGWKLESMRKLDESADFEMDEGEKKDHNKDGKIDSEDYLIAKDKAIKAAMAKKVDELADLVALAGMQGKVELDELANEPGQGTEEVTNYSVADVIKQGDDLHKTKTQHADKAKLGDNPMATEEVDVVENKLWKAYQAELEGVKK